MPIRKPIFAAAPRAGTIARSGRTVAVWAVGAALVAGSLAAPADAATQGLISTTSTGSVAISATVLQRAQITGLTDIAFGSLDPATAATASQSDCVWSNTAGKGYTITATGSGTSGAFTLAYNTKTVPYSVQWAATASQTSGTALTAGTASASLVTTATLPGCTAAPSTTSSLIVSIAATDLQTMVAAASYTGTLTLVVQPQ